MKVEEKELLQAFMRRTGMFVYPVSKETIMAFITGYSAGRHPVDKKEFDFYISLSNYIRLNYQIEQRATGLPGQIDRFIEKYGGDWVHLFKLFSNETINLNTEKNGFITIEPDFIDKLLKLNDFKTLIRCMEYIRLNSNDIFSDFNPNRALYLIKLVTPFNNGKDYPCFGILQSEKAFDELDTELKINQFVERITLEKLIENSRKINYINWTKLKVLGNFPEI